MAAPTKRALTTAVAGLSVTSPASTEVDDLVIILTSTSTTVTGVPTHTIQSGFTSIGTQTVDDGATDGRLSVAYKIATVAGAQSYQAFTASTGTSTTGCFVITKTTYDVGAAPPFASTSATSNAAPNPPALTSLTGDFMIFATGVWCYASATANTPTAPANYALEDHLAGSAINDLAYCSRSMTGLSSSTEDPAAITDNTAPACTMAATFAIKGVVPAVSATLSKTLDDLTIDADATVAWPPVSATLDKTLDDLALSATAEVGGPPPISGTLSKTLDDLTLDADATVAWPPISATLSKTLDDFTLSAAATVVSPPPEPVVPLKPYLGELGWMFGSSG